MTPPHNDGRHVGSLMLLFLTLFPGRLTESTSTRPRIAFSKSNNSLVQRETSPELAITAGVT